MTPLIPNRLPDHDLGSMSFLRLRATLDGAGFQTGANVPSYHVKALQALRVAVRLYTGHSVVSENTLADAINVTGRLRQPTLGTHKGYLELRSRLLDNRWVCNKARAETCEAIADAVYPIRLIRPHNLMDIYNWLSHPAAHISATELMRPYITLVFHAMRERPINGERLDEDYYVVAACIFARSHDSITRLMLTQRIFSSPIRAFNGQEYIIEPAKSFPILGEILEFHVAAIKAGRETPLKDKTRAILQEYMQDAGYFAE